MRKYALVRQDLEAARDRLDEANDMDRRLALVMDNIIETVLRLEHSGKRHADNVLPFPRPSETVIRLFTKR